MWGPAQVFPDSYLRLNSRKPTSRSLTPMSVDSIMCVAGDELCQLRIGVRSSMPVRKTWAAIQHIAACSTLLLPDFSLIQPAVLSSSLPWCVMVAPLSCRQQRNRVHCGAASQLHRSRSVQRSWRVVLGCSSGYLGVAPSHHTFPVARRSAVGSRFYTRDGR